MGVAEIMDRSFGPIEWKPKESTGKHTQAEMPLLAEVTQPAMLAAAVVRRATFAGVLNEAAKHSGMEDWHIADKMAISHGYMSKFMRSVGQTWGRRLVKFMQITHSLAPLQWLADQMGCDVVLRSSREARIRELEAELAEVRKAA